MRKEQLEKTMEQLRKCCKEYNEMGVEWSEAHLPKAGKLSSEEGLLLLVCYNRGKLPPLGQMIAPLHTPGNVEYMEKIIADCRRILSSGD